jgi:hypothetical protein
LVAITPRKLPFGYTPRSPDTTTLSRLIGLDLPLIVSDSLAPALLGSIVSTTGAGQDSVNQAVCAPDAF